MALNCTNNGNSRKLGQNHIHASEDCIQNHCKTQRKVCSLAPWNPPESGTWTDVHFCACNASDFNCENSVFRAQFARIWAGPHVPIILCTEVALSELWFPCSSTHLWQRVELVMGSVFLMFWICTPLLKRFYQKKQESKAVSKLHFILSYSIFLYLIVYWCFCGPIFFKAKPSSRPQDDLKTLIFEDKGNSRLVRLVRIVRIVQIDKPQPERIAVYRLSSLREGNGVADIHNSQGELSSQQIIWFSLVIGLLWISKYLGCHALEFDWMQSYTRDATEARRPGGQTQSFPGLSHSCKGEVFKSPFQTCTPPTQSRCRDSRFPFH